MPNRPTAEKSLRQNKKRNKRNKRVKSQLRTEINTFERAIERGDAEEASQQLDLVTKLLHKACKKGVLHENTAARRQSRLQKELNKLSEPSEA